MDNIKKALIPPVLIAFCGLPIAVWYDEAIGKKVFMAGFTLAVFTMLGFAWFSKASTFEATSIWGFRVSITGFAIAALPMVFATWAGNEYSKLGWNVGITILLAGLVINFLESRHAAK